MVVVSVCSRIAPRIEPVSEKRPPVSGVPPTTTAKIASSSLNSPTRMESAPLMLEVAIRPAIPAHKPLKP